MLLLRAVSTPLQIRRLPAHFAQNRSEIEGRVRVGDRPNSRRSMQPPAGRKPRNSHRSGSPQSLWRATMTAQSGPTHVDESCAGAYTGAASRIRGFVDAPPIPCEYPGNFLPPIVVQNTAAQRGERVRCRDPGSGDGRTLGNPVRAPMTQEISRCDSPIWCAAPFCRSCSQRPFPRPWRLRVARSPKAGSTPSAPGSKPLGACPLKHTDVTVDISGFIARVTVRQQFHNPFHGQDRGGLRLPALAGRGRRPDDHEGRRPDHQGRDQGAGRGPGDLRGGQGRRARWPACWTRSGRTSSPSRWPTSSRASRSTSPSPTARRSTGRTASTSSTSPWSSARATSPAAAARRRRRPAGHRRPTRCPTPTASRRRSRPRAPGPGTTSRSP